MLRSERSAISPRASPAVPKCAPYTLRNAPSARACSMAAARLRLNTAVGPPPCKIMRLSAIPYPCRSVEMLARYNFKHNAGQQLTIECSVQTIAINCQSRAVREHGEVACDSQDQRCQRLRKLEWRSIGRAAHYQCRGSGSPRVDSRFLGDSCG